LELAFSVPSLSLPAVVLRTLRGADTSCVGLPTGLRVAAGPTGFNALGVKVVAEGVGFGSTPGSGALPAAESDATGFFLFAHFMKRAGFHRAVGFVDTAEVV
jgi:hypothetical protein